MQITPRYKKINSDVDSDKVAIKRKRQKGKLIIKGNKGERKKNREEEEMKGRTRCFGYCKSIMISVVFFVR